MVHVYITLHPRQNAKQNGKDKMDIAHACGRVCRWWDTYITPQSCQDCYRVYHASSTAKTRAKRHCACVWMDLQMVGHVYHTTIVPRLLSCISRFVQCKNKDKTPLRMRVDGFADGVTHISHHNRAKTAIVYITLPPRQKQRQNAIAHACGRVCRWWGHIYHTTIVPRLLSCTSRFVQCKNKDKTPLRMRVDGFADGGTRISNHNHANRAIMYITLHPRQKTKTKRHCACVWTGLQMVGHISLVLHVFVSFPRKPLFVCLTFRESFNFLYILTIVLHDWIF